MRASRMLRWVGLPTMFGVAFWFGCAPEAVSVKSLEVAPTGTPLEQSESIPVQIDMGAGEWKTASASRAGIERAAWHWCDRVNEELGDQKLCPDQLWTEDFTTASVDAGGESCTAIGICHLRRQLCAGAYMSELARSPLQRELTYGPEPPVYLADLGVSDTEAESLGRTSTPRIRFQPLTGPGRAAAVRGALNRYREAARIAGILRSHYSASTFKTCLQTYMELDGQGDIPDLPNYADGPLPTWTDVFVQGYLDAVFEFSNNVTRAVDDTRAAADGQISGKSPVSDEIATQWNGQHDSVAGAARLLGYGELPSQQIVFDATLPTCDGAQGLGSKLSFDRIPVCPSIGTKLGVNTAIQTIRGLQISPNSTTMTDDVVAAYNADNLARGVISEPLTEVQVLAHLQINAADISSAKLYLCQEAAAFGKTFTPAPELGTNRVHGTLPPIAPPPQALATHFLGTIDTGTAVTVTDDEYAEAGAIRTMDQMKLTAAALAGTPGIDTYLDPTLGESLSDAMTLLRASVGSKRLEFKVGPYSDQSAGEVASVEINIHGTQTTDKYFAVHGMGALKCALSSDVDGAACDRALYEIPLDAPQATLDSRMVDLSGFTLTQTISSAARFPDGDSSAPLVDNEAIYVVQEVDGLREVLGGVIPKPGSVPGTWSRVALAPAGGLFEGMLGSMTMAAPDDCSKPAASCAGLPMSLWPPLESDINGQAVDPSTDTSFLHYIELARAGANEADSRGLELLRSGLAMDDRAEQATSEMIGLCGADADGNTGCGEGSGEMVPWATLGDRQACVWEVDGVRCACPVDPQGAPCPVACPLQVPADAQQPTAAALVQTCQGMLDAAGPPAGVVTVIPVFHTLGLAKSVKSGQPSACEAFDKLRTHAFLSQERRVAYIVDTLAPTWHRTRVQNIANLINYEEHFFDNYILKYGDNAVFDTRRPTRPCLNADAAPPCNVPDSQGTTGSTFWQTKIDCFEPENCDDNNGRGQDGCPGAEPIDFSMDTEPDALMHRWAWGFGHLRRSTATLGVITGELSEMMYLARVHYGAVSRLDMSGRHVVHHKLKGAPCGYDATGKTPHWLRECDPGEDKDGVSAFCVLANRSQWADESVARKMGHPKQFNAFLRNAIPDETYKAYPMYNAADDSKQPLPYPQHVDPQFIYCNAPSPTTDQDGPWDDSNEIWDGQSSGYIGSSASYPVRFLDNTEEYLNALSDMWDLPGYDLCSGSADPDPEKPWKSAIWRAFCWAPEDAFATPEDDEAFMTKGVLPGSNTNTEFASGAVVRRWIRANHDSGTMPYAQYLYDQSQGSVLSGDRPFQYPLTSRNIIDAMELACHASSVRRSSSLDCKSVDVATIQNGDLSMTELNGLLACYASWMQEIAGQTIVGPLPAEVVDAAANSTPLNGMTGLGGTYLEAMMAQYNALAAIAMDFDHMKDRQLAIALHLRSLESIDRQEGYEQEKARAQQMAAFFATAAANMKVMSDAAGGAADLEPAQALGKMVVATELIALQMEEMKSELEAISAGLGSTEEELDQKRLQVLGAAISEVAQGRDTAKALSSHINDLIGASAQLEQVKLLAARAKAKVTFQDFVNGQPVYVNTVMRRTYNTNLLRYEAALQRAKQLAFIARRAIEVRFGVDMQSMAEPMTLVEPPREWVSDVCNMEGLDYAKVRDATPNGATEDFQFGDPPPAGDDFADDFIGDYVTKLEDFVQSYSFDFPLKDGDDVAVISLAEDIWRLRATCVRPSTNLLYYSTEFDKRDSDELDDDTHGWFVDGCGETLPAEEPGGEPRPYRRCLRVAPVSVAAEGPDELDAGAPEAGVDLTGLPEGAIAYRLGNQPCIPNEPEFEGGVEDTCPEPAAGGAVAAGVLVQRMPDLVPGPHQFSIYVKLDPDAAAYDADADAGGNVAGARIIRESDGEEVVSGDGIPSEQWGRINLEFVAGYGEQYRVEVFPSSNPVPLSTESGAGQADWPGILVSAAQVERVEQDNYGELDPPTAWEVTDVRRVAPDPVCHERVGPELRSKFVRKCEVVCPNGIKESCDPEMEAARKVCFWEGTFSINLEDIERGNLIPSGQIAIGNFNFRHNLAGVNLVGTEVTSCEDVPGASCYGNGFVEYSLLHDGEAQIRNWEGGSLEVHMDPAFIEHGKGLAVERVVTNPPTSADMGLLDSYMKSELKGRPMQGMYTLRIWESPSLQWDRIEDVQLVWKYHYWTRFSH
jgi:hypothetical protein